MRNSMRLVFAAVLAVTLALLGAGTAGAHEDEDEEPAHTMVLQAIALIVNKPGDMHEIAEHIEGALSAEDREGVDLALVRQASAAMEADDLTRARELLQTSLDTGSATRSSDEPAFATAGDTGTTVVLDEDRPGTGIDGGDIVLLALAAAVIVLGGLLEWRWRPPDSVHRLRRIARTEGVER